MEINFIGAGEASKQSLLYLTTCWCLNRHLCDLQEGFGKKHLHLVIVFHKVFHKMCSVKYVLQNVFRKVFHKICSTKCVLQNMLREMCSTKCSTKCVPQNMFHEMCSVKCSTKYVHISWNTFHGTYFA